MSHKRFIINNVVSHLVSLGGISESSASNYAEQAYKMYDKSICNSKDPFRDCCNYAGQIAEQFIIVFKYKPPKQQATRRTKRPQEAFNFN